MSFPLNRRPLMWLLVLVLVLAVVFLIPWGTFEFADDVLIGGGDNQTAEEIYGGIAGAWEGAGSDVSLPDIQGMIDRARAGMADVPGWDDVVDSDQDPDITYGDLLDQVEAEVEAAVPGEMGRILGRLQNSQLDPKERTALEDEAEGIRQAFPDLFPDQGESSDE